ncbi:hypothetical protein GQ53DRAFT_830963 [Thozetella sp. PMI_491]|nr:hypothetical protein GQ53DRAFT_830963 [Thozetella sp. PMI_491]
MEHVALSTRRQTALELLQAWNEGSLEKIMSYQADDCLHFTLPQSLDREPMDNKTYASFISDWIMPNFRGFRVEIVDIIDDANSNKLAAWVRSSASTEIGPYANEYIFLLFFDEAGKKVIKHVEYTDSMHTITFVTKLRTYLAEKAADAKEQA